MRRWFQVLFTLLLLSVCLYSLGVGGDKDKKNSDPYSMSLLALKSSGTITVFVTIQTIDPQKYPLPTILQQLDAETKHREGKKFKKYEDKKVPLVNGQMSFSLQGVELMQMFSVDVQFKPKGWHDEHLEDTALVLPAPDLRVDHINAPQQAIANSPFTVEAVIREVIGSAGTAATVTLSEGVAVIGSVPNVNVQAGTSVSVAFEGMRATTVGPHTYTVTISGANPAESDGTNNTATFVVTIVQPLPLTYSLSYFYDKSISSTNYRSDGGYISLDSLFDESASLNYTAYTQGSTLPSFPLTQLSWRIETASGVFDQGSLSSVARTGGDATHDNYLLPNANQKNIDITLIVDRVNGYFQAQITQFYSQTVYILRDNDTPTPTSIEIRTLTGDSAHVLRPDGSLVVSLLLTSNGNTWGGPATLTLPPVQITGSTTTTGGGSTEDGTSWTEITVSSDNFATASGAATTATGASTSLRALKNNDVESSTPTTFSLDQNFPNPFNPGTQIPFSLPKSAFVSLKVYDMLGREVATLVSQNYPAGSYSITWNAGACPSGTYFYRLVAGDFVAQKKLILLK